MSKASSTVKNRYSSLAYDRVALRVKRGSRDMIKAHVAGNGVSLNVYILDLLHREINQSP